MKQICVFCGSGLGVVPAYNQAAHELGVTLAGRGLGLVYGGGRVGLMGVVADAVLQRGGKVVGVIPQALVDTELADAFIALPGGWGTLEEFCEIITWTQLGFHSKPSGLLNVKGFYDPFLAQVDSA